jgi:hyperosmotically inducible periplasmic protein
MQRSNTDMNITLYRNTLIAAAVATTFGLGATACSETADYSSKQARSNSATAALSDTAITTNVKAKLASDSSIRSSDISVTTANGVVTMEGYVSDAAAKSSAERTVKSVTGVTRVDNRLSTTSSGMAAIATTTDDAQIAMSDTWITTKVKASLLADSEAKGFDVNVETKDGVVTLQGELDNLQAIAHVKKIAAGVEGVRSVNVAAMTVSQLC